MANTRQARCTGHAGYAISTLSILIAVLNSEIVTLMGIVKVSLRSIEVLEFMEARWVDH